MTEGEVECRQEVRSLLVDRPGEECHMEPIEVCRPGKGSKIPAQVISGIVH